MSESPSAGTRAAEGNKGGRSAGAEESRRQRAEFKKATVCVDACPRKTEWGSTEAPAVGSARAPKEVPSCRLYGAECRMWSDCGIVLGSRARRGDGGRRPPRRPKSDTGRGSGERTKEGRRVDEIRIQTPGNGESDPATQHAGGAGTDRKEDAANLGRKGVAVHEVAALNGIAAHRTRSAGGGGEDIERLLCRRIGREVTMKRKRRWGVEGRQGMESVQVDVEPARYRARIGPGGARSDCQVDKREIGTWAGNKGMDSVGAALLSGMDEGDAYLPRVHLFVTHVKILHSMSTHEIGGQGWVDELRADRSACNPGLKLLAHGISRWRTGVEGDGPALAMMLRIGMPVLNKRSSQAGGCEWGDKGRGGREADPGGGGCDERPLRALHMRMVLGNVVLSCGGCSPGATQRSKAVMAPGRAHGGYTATDGRGARVGEERGGRWRTTATCAGAAGGAARCTKEGDSVVIGRKPP
ncbi:hypothetical protein DFH08DRAFT_931033 [Mycena albidolilacea]|uniref:Uncharacterized protein n=1 Tax=Mycena albidolilacea TaxID=1033008 RepID=A0AAD7F3J9_9AGAR|nr:hypothetical protein DFH08DRAFT_931033 [Mycena albidolilacea]